MTWKEFIAEIISSIAWPIVVLLCLALFKTELAKIVGRLAHFKYKDFEFDFDRITQQAEELPKEREEISTAKSPGNISLEDQIFGAVEHAPPAAILLAWSGLETVMAMAVARMAISPEPPTSSAMHNINLLAKHGGLSNNHAGLLNHMRTLRNKVTHEQNHRLLITQEQASKYANVAIKIIQHLESLKKPM